MNSRQFAKAYMSAVNIGMEANRIWEEEGRPEGKAAQHWDAATNRIRDFAFVDYTLFCELSKFRTFDKKKLLDNLLLDRGLVNNESDKLFMDNSYIFE